MRLTKEQKEQLFIEQRYYLDYLVHQFLEKHETFRYLKDDLKSECYMRFVELIDKYDGDRSKFSTYLHEQLEGYMKMVLRTEVKLGQKSDRYRDEFGTEEPWYEYDTDFEDVLTEADLTDNQRTILRMRYIKDMELIDIATKLNISQPAVTRTLQRSYNKLRKYYENLH